METLESLLSLIDLDLKAGKLIAPDKWLDRAMELSMFLEGEQIKEAELESDLARAIELIVVGQDGKVNMTRAENEVKKTGVWLELKKQQARVKKIENYIGIAKKHASRMY